MVGSCAHLFYIIRTKSKAESFFRPSLDINLLSYDYILLIMINIWQAHAVVKSQSLFQYKVKTVQIEFVDQFVANLGLQKVCPYFSRP